MKYSILFMMICLPLGCTSPSRTLDAPLTWTANDLEGYTYILQDTNRTDYTIQWEGKDVTITNTIRHARYTFLTDGTGTASYGIVNGPLCAPAIRWEILRTGALVADDDIFWLMKRDGDRVFVNRKGRSEVYIRQIR